MKDYPELETSGRGEAGSKAEQQDLRTFDAVPSETAADVSGDVSSMRRRLADSLYLVVRRAGERGWAFPQARNEGGESISDTAQRALASTIGRTHPVFFIGNAPMAHLHARPKGRTFFMLAQAVDDPWDMRLLPDGPADEHAWVTKAELLSSYLADARLRELVHKML